MGLSVSFPPLSENCPKLPIRNSWELISESYQIPLPIFYDFELPKGPCRTKITTA